MSLKGREKTLYTMTHRRQAVLRVTGPAQSGRILLTLERGLWCLGMLNALDWAFRFGAHLYNVESTGQLIPSAGSRVWLWSLISSWFGSVFGREIWTWLMLIFSWDYGPGLWWRTDTGCKLPFGAFARASVAVIMQHSWGSSRGRSAALLGT